MFTRQTPYTRNTKNRKMKNNPTTHSGCTRRGFLGGAVAAMATAVLESDRNYALGQAVHAETPKRKLKLGLVGCGRRGNWIAQLFLKHGGYELHAVADYFQHVADAQGDKRGVPKERRFSGLSGLQEGY